MTTDQAGAIPSIPVFAGHVESKAAEVLNVLIFAHGGGDVPIHAEQLIPIRASLTSLVDCLFPIKETAQTLWLDRSTSTTSTRRASPRWRLSSAERWACHDPNSSISRWQPH
jgi:hypothetical protein